MKRTHSKGLFVALVVIPLLVLSASCSGRAGPVETTPGTAEAPVEPTTTRPMEHSLAARAVPEPVIDSPLPSGTPPATPPAAPQEQATPSTVTAIPTEAPTPRPTATPLQAIAHTVQAGESLLRLAQTYQVPIAAIQLENDLGERISIQAGQVLTIPAATEWDDASPYWLLHVVQAGDTLTGIAANNGLKVAAIQEANHLTDADTLAIGQLLILPFSGPEGILALAPPPPASVSETDQSGGAAAPLPPALPAAPVAGWPGEVLHLINGIRAAHGLYALTYSGELATAAQYHAQDCANRGWCSHTGSDGSGSLTRILRAGFPATGSSECWVQARSSQQAVEWWMNEVPPNDPHRRTLLSTYLTHIGVGVVQTGWGYYFVADFATTE
jgi:uncharacterized protein YkwD